MDSRIQPNQAVSRPDPNKIGVPALAQPLSTSAPLGTIRTSDLKKNIKPLELASSFVDAYLDKDLSYPEIGRMTLRMYFHMSFQMQFIWQFSNKTLVYNRSNMVSICIWRIFSCIRTIFTVF